jgi:hypothetical protein
MTDNINLKPVINGRRIETRPSGTRRSVFPMTCRDRTPRKSQKSRPDLSLSARTWGSKISSPGSEPYHRRVAIEVSGDAVVAAGLANAGLPVVVVNPAQCGEAAAGKANHRNGYDAFAGALTRGSIRTFPATAETENTASYQGGAWLGDLDSNQD